MSASDTDTSADPDAEYGYTEWRCTNCGHSAPKHNPPCDRCGNMSFEQVEVRASDFDDEIRAASTLEVARDNALTVGAGIGVLLVAGLFVLANSGAVVLADPVGLGIRYGTVDATAPDDDGRLSAAEFHGRVAAEFGDTSLSWYGRTLELSYASSADSNAALVDELVRISGWYAEYVADGGDAARLRVTADVGDGRARVVVDRADAAAFAAGDISEAEFRSRVVGSSGS